MNELPTELRFPKPPFRLARSVLDDLPPADLLSSYLDEIRHWRSAVLAFLERPEAERTATLVDFTERAGKALATCLASVWSEKMAAWVKVSPYNLNPFPAHALDTTLEASLDGVLEVLRWRAGVLDMLSDIWDVFDEPELDLEESTAMGQFLHPAGERHVCPYCLTEFDSDRMHADRHQCLLLSHVRAKWPELPPSMKRWAEEARRAGDPMSAPAPTRRKWWQVWR